MLEALLRHSHLQSRVLEVEHRSPKASGVPFIFGYQVLLEKHSTVGRGRVSVLAKSCPFPDTYYILILRPKASFPNSSLFCTPPIFTLKFLSIRVRSNPSRALPEPCRTPGMMIYGFSIVMDEVSPRMSGRWVGSVSRRSRLRKGREGSM